MLNSLNKQQLGVHVPVAGWLLIISNAVFLLVGGFVFLLLSGIGIAAQDAEATGILVVVGTAMAGLMTVLALPGVAAGVGLLARKTWGRVLAIVVSVLGLTNFPIGTLIGVYIIWVLLQEEASEYFLSRSHDDDAAA